MQRKLVYTQSTDSQETVLPRGSAMYQNSPLQQDCMTTDRIYCLVYDQLRSISLVRNSTESDAIIHSDLWNVQTVAANDTKLQECLYPKMTTP